jgi:fibronectin type 3 domain-containing protein
MPLLIPNRFRLSQFRFLFITVFTSILVSRLAFSASINLAWDPNTDSVSGYKVCWGTESGQYQHTANAMKNATYTVDNLNEGRTYYFAVKAYNNSGVESEFSNEVSGLIPQKDTDKDGIPDVDEINLYGTDPVLKDTDADGIDDGNELEYWKERWNADLDADGLINLLDPDADDDGILDNDEINLYHTDPERANGSASISLAWDANVGPVAGYKVCWGTESGNYQYTVDVQKKTTHTITNLEEDCTYYFAVKAYNDESIESEFSNEVSSYIPQKDTDSDGIPDADEINLYQTNPVKADTDADGIDDGDEVAFWQDQWNADIDADGLINLLDPDADNDGILDINEINLYHNNLEIADGSASVNLTWDSYMDSVAGYKVHWGTESGIYQFTVDAQNNTTYTAPNLEEGRTYYFAVKAYDDNGTETDFSNEVSNVIPEKEDQLPTMVILSLLLDL